jgi:hypothetical protein
MKNSRFTSEQEATIQLIMDQPGNLTRKAAIRKMRQNAKANQAHKKVTPVDVKSAAANDKPEAVAAPVVPVATKKAAAPVAKKTAAEVSAARGEGIRLFKVAGRPTKAQFIAVYDGWPTFTFFVKVGIHREIMGSSINRKRS